jgi:hypothetical protein
MTGALMPGAPASTEHSRIFTGVPSSECFRQFFGEYSADIAQLAQNIREYSLVIR